MTGINRIPLGYLDMVGTKTGGKNPDLGLESVQPVIEMTPFYHAYKLTTIHDDFVVTGGSDKLDVFVPEDKIWFLYGASLIALWVLGTDRLKFRIGLRNLNDALNADRFTIFSSAELDRAATDSSNGVGVMLPVPIALTSGSAVSFETEFRVGSPRTYPVQILVAEFDA